MKNLKKLLILPIALLLTGCDQIPQASVSNPEAPSIVETSEASVSETSTSSEEVVVNNKLVNISDLATGEISENVTKGIFTFYKNGDGETKKKFEVVELENAVEFEDKSFTKVLKTQSAGVTAQDKLARVIAFEATGKGKVTVICKSPNESTRSITIYNKEKAVVHSKVDVTAEISKVELDFHYAGTYYVSAPENIQIYSIEADWQDGVNEDWEPAIELSNSKVLNISELPAKDYNKSVNVGMFTINAGEKYTNAEGKEASAVVTIDSNNKTLDGVKYTQRLKLGGLGTVAVKSVTIHATEVSRLTVVCMSSSSSKTTSFKLVKLNADKTEGDLVEETTDIDGGSLHAYSFSLEAAGDYCVYGSATQGINIYSLIIE